MTAVEEISTPDVEVEINWDIPKTYCPFAQESCCGEICKFWFGDDCIIVKSLTKIYTSDEF